MLLLDNCTICGYRLASMCCRRSSSLTLVTNGLFGSFFPHLMFSLAPPASQPASKASVLVGGIFSRASSRRRVSNGGGRQAEEKEGRGEIRDYRKSCRTGPSKRTSTQLSGALQPMTSAELTSASKSPRPLSSILDEQTYNMFWPLARWQYSLHHISSPNIFPPASFTCLAV